MEYALHQWAPPGSPVRIEYPAGLLKQLRPEQDGEDVIGILWGSRIANQVQVAGVGARPELHPVGIFAARSRGEVFLTEADLQRFDAFNPGAIALVLAGETAGFFVRESDGSIQSIQSYEEIPLAPAQAAPRAISSRLGGWSWPGVTTICVILALLAIPLLTASYWRTQHSRAPHFDLAVHDSAGEMRVSWDRVAAGRKARLEIVDGSERHTISATDVSSVTFVRISSDVEIALVTGDGAREIARFFSPFPAPALEKSQLRASVAGLEAEARTLRANIARDNLHIHELEGAVSRLSETATPEP
jgi:hypothetical protein